MKPKVIVIQGPTASGKTDWGVHLAKALGGEVVSADARQFYREMSIGTAKPSLAEMDGVVHHFIDSLSIHQAYSAGEFERDALATTTQLIAEGTQSIVVGGSGLYVKALIEGLDDLPANLALRNELIEIHRKNGLTALQDRMKRADPKYYERMDQANPARLIRGIELVETSGIPMSQLQGKGGKERPFTPIKIAPAVDRNLLYARINKRVDLMIEKGLVDEAKALFAHKHLPALQTVGYQEIFAHLEGHSSQKEAVELIKRNTRRYAKRQLTWLRRDPDIKWFKPEEIDEMWHWLKATL